MIWVYTIFLGIVVCDIDIGNLRTFRGYKKQIAMFKPRMWNSCVCVQSGWSMCNLLFMPSRSDLFSKQTVQASLYDWHPVKTVELIAFANSEDSDQPSLVGLCNSASCLSVNDKWMGLFKRCLSYTGWSGHTHFSQVNRQVFYILTQIKSNNAFVVVLNQGRCLVLNNAVLYIYYS